MIYIIGNKRLSVAVDSIGAELNSVKKDGKEMLWQNEDGSWAGHSPILFPFGGKCVVNIDGKIYDTPKHGVLRRNEFTLVSQTEKELVLSFSSNESTKALYPYDFTFTVRYSVRGTSLYIDYTVENDGAKEMYFGCGGHESFNIDKSLDKYCIEFEKEETLLRFYHNDDGYLTGETRKYPKSKFLNFKDVPIENSETLIFKGIRSSWCKLVKNGGETVATTYFKGFKNILFWRPESARMVCMEPWMNLPDRLGDKTDFREKAGIKTLAPGQKSVIKRKITY
ncbi:MAG: hypothetical protein IJQ87_02675 [Clostridia bacterium]|nr:hypothetical protein [Clostridia bacterium]